MQLVGIYCEHCDYENRTMLPNFAKSGSMHFCHVCAKPAESIWLKKILSTTWMTGGPHYCVESTEEVREKPYV